MRQNADFRYDLEVGQMYEKWLGDLLEGSTIEVKRDFRASQTGKVFVEFFCREKPSGISTTEAEFWAFILAGKTVVLLPTETLKVLARNAYKKGHVVNGGDSDASRGVLIDVERLVKQCLQ